MKKEIFEEDEFGNNCAGQPVKGVMTLYSSTLIDGYNKFAENAEHESNIKNIQINNSACILFSTSAIESKTNEFISMNILIDMDNKIPLFKEIKRLEQKLSLEDKWNLISTILKSPEWDNSKEPYQSYNTIKSLRNELVHFKGTPYGKNEAPTKKIIGLLSELNIKNESSFIEDDFSSWIDDLLRSPKLGKWVANKTNRFMEEIQELRKFNPFKGNTSK